MAVLGFQFVFSLVMFSFFQKLSPFYSFGRWLLSKRIVRYLHPTDEELRILAGISQGGGKGKGRRNEYKKMLNSKSKSDSFNVPRNAPIQLESAKVDAIDLLPLHFYTDYQWLVDFSLGASVVYFLTEIYFAVSSHRIEINVSILWCLLTIGFCLKALWSQMLLYFKVEEGGERTLCLTFGFFYLVVAMGILVVGNDVLEFGLEEGYDNFSGNAVKFLKHQGVESHGPISLLTFKIVLAFICSFIGAFLTFPGLRLAKLHLDSLKYAKENLFKQLAIYVNFLLPLLIILSWVKPLGRDILCGRNWTFTRRGAVLSDDVFDSVRLLIVLIFFVMRLLLLPIHMQSHLNLAHEKIEQLKKESGKISSLELQKMVARVFYYLCVVAVQYITPAILILFLTFLLKTLGNYSWTAVLGESVTSMWSVKNASPGLVAPPASTNTTTNMESIVETAAKFTWALDSMRNIFTHLWYRGILSLLSWWVCFSWFVSTLFGLMYYSQIEKA